MLHAVEERFEVVGMGLILQVQPESAAGYETERGDVVPVEDSIAGGIAIRISSAKRIFFDFATIQLPASLWSTRLPFEVAFVPGFRLVNAAASNMRQNRRHAPVLNGRFGIATHTRE